MAEHRDALAAELKRAFESATATQAAKVPSSLAAVRRESLTPQLVESEVTSDATAGSISFTMPLLRAVLAGQKTQTRRPIRPVPTRVEAGVPIGPDASPIAPLCEAGGRLWVREKWARLVNADGERFVYAIDEPTLRVRWNSSRFMPRAAARRFLLVDQVSVARLSAIDDEDATREGAAADPSAAMFGPRAWFIGAWESIYGEGEFSAANDPWVWVIDFRLESVTS